MFFFSNTSVVIQNDIIECISCFLMNKIKEKVNCYNFVAVVMDETTNVSNKSQLLTIFCCVTLEWKVEKKLLVFLDVTSQHTLSRLPLILFKYINQLQCREKPKTSHTYDGAPLTSGLISARQTLVKQKYSDSRILLVHCFAHMLNLVSRKFVESIKVCKIFVQMVSGFSSFFHKILK